MANLGYIQVNRYCNQKCHFCSNPFTGRSISYDKGVELIDDFVARGYHGVIFTGGEPTLAKDLPRWVSYARDIGLNRRMISNGLICADYDYVRALADAGLETVHFSLYSYVPSVHEALTDIPGSYRKILSAIGNALDCGIGVHINTVINRFNQDHLDKNVAFLAKHFPAVRHQIWNNLDPKMMRKTPQSLATLPDFASFEAPLGRAMRFLSDSGRTFRVEMVPLCYMRGFEEFSTETRKIVKDEERIIHFLDERGSFHKKGDGFQPPQHFRPGCAGCGLRPVCGGITEGATTYAGQPEKPQTVTPAELARIVAAAKSPD